MAAGYFAHTPGDKNHQPAPADWQPLAEHLLAVARLGNGFARDARPFVTPDTDECRQEKQALHEGAFWAGLLHDLGKYRPEFQQMLWKQHPKNEQTRHKQAGAAFASQQGRWDLAFAIAGHHGGLPDAAQLKNLIAGPGGSDVAAPVEPIAKSDCPALKNRGESGNRGQNRGHCRFSDKIGDIAGFLEENPQCPRFLISAMSPISRFQKTCNVPDFPISRFRRPLSGRWLQTS